MFREEVVPVTYLLPTRYLFTLTFQQREKGLLRRYRDLKNLLTPLLDNQRKDAKVCEERGSNGKDTLSTSS